MKLGRITAASMFFVGSALPALAAPLPAAPQDGHPSMMMLAQVQPGGGQNVGTASGTPVGGGQSVGTASGQAAGAQDTSAAPAKPAKKKKKHASKKKTSTHAASAPAAAAPAKAPAATPAPQ